MHLFAHKKVLKYALKCMVFRVTDLSNLTQLCKSIFLKEVPHQMMTEGRVRTMVAGDENSLPIYDHSHSNCSSYIFVSAALSETGDVTITRAMIMHSSFGYLLNHRADDEFAKLSEFMEAAEGAVLLIPICTEKRKTSFEVREFPNSAEKHTKSFEEPLVKLPPIAHHTGDGWEMVFDINRDKDSIIIRSDCSYDYPGGQAVGYDLAGHIKNNMHLIEQGGQTR